MKRKRNVDGEGMKIKEFLGVEPSQQREIPTFCKIRHRIAWSLSGHEFVACQ